MRTNYLTQFFIEIYSIISFSLRFFKEILFPPYELNEILLQSHSLGLKSLPLVGITSFVMGIVLVLQTRPALVQFGAGSYVASMSAVSIIREVGPMITGMVCAGNIGSTISAELGSMKVTEQIDAMEVSGARPFKYLVVSRIVATTFVIPILVFYSDTVSLFGSFLGANVKGEISIDLFFAEVFEKLSFDDVMPSVIKTFFFGFSIGLIGCYKGFNSEKGTEGVGRSANSAVIISMIIVMIIDMIAAQISTIFNLL